MRMRPSSSRSTAWTTFLWRSRAANGILGSLLSVKSRPGDLGAKVRPPGDPAARTQNGIGMRGRRRQGLNGTYLFELEVQPGGPEGRPVTIAGSQPIAVVGRP